MGLKRDLYYAKWLCRKREVAGYQQVYFETNEDLDKIFKNVDFNDKDVLSVLSSSDQLFKLGQYNIKSIDTFDKNILTYYYYFMRIWTIKYFGQLYPTGLISNDYLWIDGLLSSVNPESVEEKNALIFWKSLFDKNVDFSKMFIRNSEKSLNYSKNVDDCKIPDNFNFSHINLFKKQKFDKKYDVAVISNIMEWSNGDARFLERLYWNLNQLLRDDGVVLCSRMAYNTSLYGVSLRNALGEKFIYNDFGNDGYVYQKKI